SAHSSGACSSDCRETGQVYRYPRCAGAYSYSDNPEKTEVRHMIKIDLSNLLQDSIGKNGLTKEDFNNVKRTALNDLLNTEQYPENAFLTLPDTAYAEN